MASIGKLVSVEVRELWKHEEYGFSAWLENNLEILSEAIDFELSDPERELAAGDFRVDLVAKDEKANRVVIENQLEATNHDHLGKVITYLSNLDAKVAIWIATEAREEHIRAIQWLNENTSDGFDFYLVRLAAYRIANSDPAPLFTVIVGPSEDAKKIGKVKTQPGEQGLSGFLCQRVWVRYLLRAPGIRSS